MKIFKSKYFNLSFCIFFILISILDFSIKNYIMCGAMLLNALSQFLFYKNVIRREKEAEEERLQRRSMVEIRDELIDELLK